MKIVYWLNYCGAVLNRITGWRLSRLNRWIYSATGGILGNTTAGARIILLTTTGRKSGRPHTTPVASWNLGSDLIVGSFAGGSPTDPQWLHNLRKDPYAQVQLKRETFRMKATVVEGVEREDLMREVAKISRAFEFYESRGRRKGAIVRLTRTT